MWLYNQGTGWQSVNGMIKMEHQGEGGFCLQLIKLLAEGLPG